MIETQLQKLVVDAVIANGGYAMKMQGINVVGIADLLIKLPSFPAFVLEAKRDKYAAVPRANTVEITFKQREFLDAVGKAGMKTGVLSFQITGAGIKSLCAAVYPHSLLTGPKRTKIETLPTDYWFVGNHTARYAKIVEMLTEFAQHG